jgi:fatty-acyl-CoA synthase
LTRLMPEVDATTNPATQTITSEAFPAFRRAVLIGDSAHTGFLPFAELLALGDSVSDETLRARQAAVSPDDVFQIQYTSGTTGSPKGAMITYRGTINNAAFVARRAGLGPADRMVSAMPMFHTAGNIVDQLSMLVVGGTMVKAIAFDAVKMLELIANERGSVIDAVPTMIIAMLREPRFSEFDTSSLRVVIAGGTPIPVAVMEEVKARLGAEPAIVLGMTEASPIISQTLASDGFALRSSTVGIPLPHTEVKIVDPDGQPVPLGTSGELLVRGYGVMKGYYKMPAKTAEAIDADGWLHSGDLATMDASGYLRIVGRLKDMIIRGGENVYPAEVESVLMRHPKISDVQVVGVPDDYMGEEGAAFIRVRANELLTVEEMIDFCKIHMARHKWPKHWRFIEEFPTTPSGKIKKFELRATLVGEGKPAETHR